MEQNAQDSALNMLMYLITFAIVMLFAGFLSAYIVSSMGQYWVHITPPTQFWISNLILILSSATMYLGYKAQKDGLFSKAKQFLILTLILGIGFGVSQFSGWNTIAEIGGAWETHTTEFGPATSWNEIDKLVDGSGTYGVDYDIRIDGEALLYKDKELYAPNDPLMTTSITSKVRNLTNNSSGYLWVLILMHLLHLLFGIIFIASNFWVLMKARTDSTKNVLFKMLNTYWHFIGGLWLVLFYVLFLK
jgi:heme/copper-type cytochrome/quinol oxidase subunit 3